MRTHASQRTLGFFAILGYLLVLIVIFFSKEDHLETMLTFYFARWHRNRHD